MTQVTFTFAARKGETRVTLRHTGYGRTPAWVDNYGGTCEGWAYLLTNLKWVVKNGTRPSEGSAMHSLLPLLIDRAGESMTKWPGEKKQNDCYIIAHGQENLAIKRTSQRLKWLCPR